MSDHEKSLTLIFSLLLIFCFKAQARQLTVGAHGDFQKITAAISNSKNGDTILVNPGIYKEGNIIITKKLHLIGKGYPIIDGESKGEIISIKADSVTFEGFTIQHSGYASLQDPAGIKIYDSREILQIVNNIVNDTFFGIYAQYAIGYIIKNNRLTSHGKLEQEIGNGIHCWKSDSMQITGNTISGHRDGIYFEFVTNSLIWLNNSCKNIRYGLHFMFSHNDSYISLSSVITVQV
ncbi:MAG: right-handed parallel beta-helix repeat-containing protein [Bacteroidia bacterium]